MKEGPALEVESGASGSVRTWNGINTMLAVFALVALGGAAAVFLFGVVLTHGVYGSRLAWLLGVVLPLLVIASGCAMASAKYRSVSSKGEAVATGGNSGGDRRTMARTVAMICIGLVAVPFLLAALLLGTYGVLILVHWIGH